MTLCALQQNTTPALTLSGKNGAPGAACRTGAEVSAVLYSVMGTLRGTNNKDTLIEQGAVMTYFLVYFFTIGNL